MSEHYTGKRCPACRLDLADCVRCSPAEVLNAERAVAEVEVVVVPFRPSSIADRLALVTAGAKWGGHGPVYGANEKAVIAALTGIANDHGWVATYDADRATWVVASRAKGEGQTDG
jgi:hypothetical protein